MIRELIEFASAIKYPDTASKSRRKFDNKICVVKTVETPDGVGFADYELLEDDTAVEAFLKTVPDLNLPEDANGFRGWIIRQNGIRKGNKRLGSTSGLMNSVPYVFIISEKNFDAFEKKVSKMHPPKVGWKTYPDLQTKLTDSVRSVYQKFWANAGLMRDTAIGTLVFALVPEKLVGIQRKDIYLAFETDRKPEWENEDNLSSRVMACPICSSSAILGAHEDDTYQPNKPFFRRPGRPDSVAFRLCSICSEKYSEAKQSIKTAGFRLFPLFHKDHIPPGMAFLNDDGSAKSFRQIFNEIHGHMKRQKYDFQIMGMAGNEIWLCDYVTGYSPFFEGTDYTRFDAEGDAWEVLGIGNGKRYPYFSNEPDSLKRLSGRMKGYIYSTRESIFDFVYRGRNNLTREMVSAMADVAVRNAIIENKSTTKRCEDICKIAFRLFTILRWKTMEDIPKDDQENAEKIGRAFRIVVGFSKAGNEHNLLTSVLDKPRMEDVKRSLAKLLDKFHYRFGEFSREDQTLVSDCLKAKYKTEKFEPLKMYFYAGYFGVKK